AVASSARRSRASTASSPQSSASSSAPDAMSFLDGLRHRLSVLRKPRSYDRELEEELRFHLSLEAMQQEYAGRGALSASDACARARRRFGNPTYHKEETRQISGLGFFDMA